MKRIYVLAALALALAGASTAAARALPAAPQRYASSVAREAQHSTARSRWTADRALRSRPHVVRLEHHAAGAYSTLTM